MLENDKPSDSSDGKEKEPDFDIYQSPFDADVYAGLPEHFVVTSTMTDTYLRQGEGVPTVPEEQPEVAQPGPHSAPQSTTTTTTTTPTTSPTIATRPLTTTSSGAKSSSSTTTSSASSTSTPRSDLGSSSSKKSSLFEKVSSLKLGKKKEKDKEKEKGKSTDKLRTSSQAPKPLPQMHTSLPSQTPRSLASSSQTPRTNNPTMAMAATQKAVGEVHQLYSNAFGPWFANSNAKPFINSLAKKIAEAAKDKALTVDHVKPYYTNAVIDIVLSSTPFYQQKPLNSQAVADAIRKHVLAVRAAPEEDKGASDARRAQWLQELLRTCRAEYAKAYPEDFWGWVEDTIEPVLAKEIKTQIKLGGPVAQTFFRENDDAAKVFSVCAQVILYDTTIPCLKELLEANFPGDVQQWADASDELEFALGICVKKVARHLKPDDDLLRLVKLFDAALQKHLSQEQTRLNTPGAEVEAARTKAICTFISAVYLKGAVLSPVISMRETSNKLSRTLCANQFMSCVNQAALMSTGQPSKKPLPGKLQREIIDKSAGVIETQLFKPIFASLA